MPKSTSKTAKESSFEKKLHSIVEDRTSGAADIEKKVIALFEEIIRDNKRNSRLFLPKAISNIKKQFSSMANILNLVNFVEKTLHKEDINQISDSIKSYRQEIEHDRRLTVARAARRIKSYRSIFTLSGSSMILRSILKAKNLGWNGVIRIVESRPKKEGVSFAKKTAGAGIRTEIGVDAIMTKMIKNSGAVFIGADAVTQTYFVNKIGSEIAMEYADKFGKPVYVVADKSKVVSNKIYEFIPDRNPENEIIPKRLRNIEILNNYFEKVDPRGRFHYVCGDRVMGPNEIKKLLKHKP